MGPRALFILLLSASVVRSEGLQWRTTAFGREAALEVPSHGKPGYAVPTGAREVSLAADGKIDASK
jgi:hypothetical protein